MQKIMISHTVLYSKGWYKKGNIWKDLIKTLECDGYTPFDKGDILGILMSSFDKLNPEKYFRRINEIVSGISPKECWRKGYYTKDCKWLEDSEELPEYDYYEAVARYILSCFTEIHVSEFERTEPDFDNCLPSSREAQLITNED